MNIMDLYKNIFRVVRASLAFTCAVLSFVLFVRIPNKYTVVLCVIVTITTLFILIYDFYNFVKEDIGEL
jgi:hypothetical protein